MTPLPQPAEAPKARAFEAIVNHIEQQVLSGELKAGEHLPGERELVTTFQVSRSSVREEPLFGSRSHARAGKQRDDCLSSR